MRNPTLTVAAFAPDRDRARRDLDGFAAPQFAGEATDVGYLVDAGGVDAIVSDVRDRAGRSVIAQVVAVRAHGRRLPIVFHFGADRRTFEELAAAVTDETAVECAIRRHDSLGETLLRVTAPGWRPRPASHLIRELTAVVDAPLRAVLIALAFKASARLSVRTLADWVRMQERTLRDRLLRARLPSPSTLLGYFTALHATWLLDVCEWHPKAVAAELGYSHSGDLTRMLWHFAGKPAMELRNGGGYADLVRHVRDVLRGTATSVGTRERRPVAVAVAQEVTAVGPVASPSDEAPSYAGTSAVRASADGPGAHRGGSRLRLVHGGADEAADCSDDEPPPNKPKDEPPSPPPAPLRLYLIPMTERERERMLQPDLLTPSVAARVRELPVDLRDGWARIPIDEEELIALCDIIHTLLSAAAQDGLLEAERELITLRLRVERIWHEKAALPDPPIPGMDLPLSIEQIAVPFRRVTFEFDTATLKLLENHTQLFEEAPPPVKALLERAWTSPVDLLMTELHLVQNHTLDWDDAAQGTQGVEVRLATVRSELIQAARLAILSSASNEGGSGPWSTLPIIHLAPCQRFPIALKRRDETLLRRQRGLPAQLAAWLNEDRAGREPYVHLNCCEVQRTCELTHAVATTKTKPNEQDEWERLSERFEDLLGLYSDGLK